MERKILVFLLIFLSGFTQIFSQNSSDEELVVDAIIITGNRKTKPHIIKRELLFKEGDTLLLSELDELSDKSRKNLLNSSLFNFAEISHFTYDSVKYNFIVDVTERWYTWPNPIFEISERNFNSWWKDKDYDRINYGFFIEQQNFRGRNEVLKWLMRFGYDERYAFEYKVPYINKKQTLGLGMKVGIKRNHEVAYQTYENKLEHIKDEDEYMFNQYFATLNLNIRKKIHETHNFYLGFEENEYGDTVLALNPDFSPSSVKKYSFFSLYYIYKNDHRDIKAYPLNGHYFDIGFYKLGLGVLEQPTVNQLFVKSSVRKYIKLNNKFYFASGLSGKLSALGKQPYQILQGLGYGRDFVRGYEYYVIDGEAFALSKSNLKFELLPTKVYNIGIIPTERFSKIHLAMYLNAYIDAGYVKDDYYYLFNNLTNSWLVGGGAGLDLVTYYDKVLRVEYSINKMNQSGVFLHFIAPI